MPSLKENFRSCAKFVFQTYIGHLLVSWTLLAASWKKISTYLEGIWLRKITLPTIEVDILWLFLTLISLFWIIVIIKSLISYFRKPYWFIPKNRLTWKAHKYNGDVERTPYCPKHKLRLVEALEYSHTGNPEIYFDCAKEHRIGFFHKHDLKKTYKFVQAIAESRLNKP